MNPATPRQAVFQALQVAREHARNLSPATRKRYLQRIATFSDAIWRRWQVGPYRLKCKHVRWYMTVQLAGAATNTQYAHWLAIRRLLRALKRDHWLSQLNGPWTAPKTG